MVESIKGSLSTEIDEDWQAKSYGNPNHRPNQPRRNHLVEYGQHKTLSQVDRVTEGAFLSEGWLIP